MSAPAIIYILIMSVELLYRAYTHGKPKEPPHTDDFWPGFVSITFITLLLIWGGFFK